MVAPAHVRRDRRTLLKVLAGAPAAGLTIVPATETRAYDPGADEKRARYREDSEEVRAFYRTNKYETLRK